ncbi:MAG: hypothetical protein EOP19_30210 [Hyphomicrobiales bacterium]|nr:MAG: hypothetical protein EOP19_30210 [Hyphomicrobiales bacterium]
MPTDLAESAQPVGLAAAFARRGIHYGWAVAAVTFLTMLVTPGAPTAPAVTSMVRKVTAATAHP